MINSKLKLKVYFIGVGGAGMSVLAKLLLNKNFDVYGSDINKSKTVEDLIEKGLIFYNTHSENNVLDKDVIVYSSAIKSTNVELIKAKELNKAVYSRAELLSVVINSYKKSVGVAGSHGKTTASCMIANVLKYASVDFTGLLGGEDINFGNYVYNNRNGAMLTEICEFDKNISKLSPNLALVLNIDNDHLDSYGSLENLKNEFFSYLNRAKYKIVNLDDNRLMLYKAKNVITYGIKNTADYNAKNLVSNDGKYSFDLFYKQKFIKTFTLGVYGRHNVYNALATISVCHAYFNLSFEKIYKGILSFKGVLRRFEEVKLLKNKTVILDYAHHPTEIEKAIETANEVFSGNYLLVFQPHTYSRTQLLFNDFIRVLSNKNAIIYKEYPAREKYTPNGSAKRLSKYVKNSSYVFDFQTLLSMINNSNEKNVLVLGAGDLYDKIKNADI